MIGRSYLSFSGSNSTSVFLRDKSNWVVFVYVFLPSYWAGREKPFLTGGVIPDRPIGRQENVNKDCFWLVKKTSVYDLTIWMERCHPEKQLIYTWMHTDVNKDSRFRVALFNTCLFSMPSQGKAMEKNSNVVRLHRIICGF